MWEYRESCQLFLHMYGANYSDRAVLATRPRRSLAGIAGLKPAWSTDICLLCVLCVVRYRSVLRARHSFRGDLPRLGCLSVIMKPLQLAGPSPLGAVDQRKL